MSQSASRIRRRGTILAATVLALVASGLWIGWAWYRVQPDQRFAVAAVVDGAPRSIEVETFLPVSATPASGPHPAVLLLHGVEGADRYRSAHHRTARWLADRGYAVFFVHYFSGGDYDDLWRLRADGDFDVEAIEAVCRQDADDWTSVVTQTLKAVAARPDVDRSRIAIDGNSLGGFVALSATAAALRDDQVADPRGVIVNWGALFESTKLAAGFPPTLFIHGEKDTVVPLDSARNAVEALRSVESEATLFVVPGAPHVTRSPESDARTLRFLEQHLGPLRRAAPRNADGERSAREAAIGSNLWTMSSPLFH